MHEWEIWARMRAPVPVPTLRRFVRLQAFIGTTSESFEPYVSDKLDEIIKLVHSDIYKRPADGDAEPFSVDPSLVDRRTHGGASLDRHELGASSVVRSASSSDFPTPWSISRMLECAAMGAAGRPLGNTPGSLRARACRKS